MASPVKKDDSLILVLDNFFGVSHRAEKCRMVQEQRVERRLRSSRSRNARIRNLGFIIPPGPRIKQKNLKQRRKMAFQTSAFCSLWEHSPGTLPWYSDLRRVRSNVVDAGFCPFILTPPPSFPPPLSFEGEGRGGGTRSKAATLCEAGGRGADETSLKKRIMPPVKGIKSRMAPFSTTYECSLLDFIIEVLLIFWYPLL